MSSRLRVQADDFFNAYKVLNENNHNAVDGCESYKKPLVDQVAFGATYVGGVDIVCLAFSVELYMKDLHFVLKGKAPRGKDSHNILWLFEELPEPVRQNIFSHEVISQNPFMTRGDLSSPEFFSKEYSPYDRFKDQIKAISDAFVEWRYAYEHTALNYNISFALSFIEAVKSVADSIGLRPA